MNFLAHLFLSGENHQLRLGNFIGDFVKGKKMNTYSPEIIKGIKIHRDIDRFTDSHPIVKNSKIRLRPKYSHYSPVIVDIFYDHFLALHWSDYHQIPLMEYTESFYKSALEDKDLLPEAARNMLTFMQRDNWLFNYQYLEGIHRSLTGMSHRTSFESKMQEATEDLKKDYALYEADFRLFFPILTQHVSQLILK